MTSQLPRRAGGHRELTALSCPADPDAAPVVQGVDVVNSTLVRVAWSSVPKERVHGQLRGYQVSAPAPSSCGRAAHAPGLVPGPGRGSAGRQLVP